MADSYSVHTMLQAILTVVLLYLGYAVTLLIYRLTLHPLARFPGPKLAAASYWYGFYYEVVLKGQFTVHMQQDLHKRYGPIVRITPDELHIDDPDYYETFYTKHGRLDKDPRWTPFFGAATSIFATPSAEVHKTRRIPLNSVFSRKRILEMEPILQQKVAKLVRKIVEYRDAKRPIRIELALMAMTEDMITELCFGRCFDKIDSPEFDDCLHGSICAMVQSGYIAIYFPFIPKIMMSLPPDMLAKMDARFGPTMQLRKTVRQWAQEVKEGTVAAKSDSPHAAVLTELNNSTALSMEDKLPHRIGDEAQNLLGAGVTTTGWTTTMTAYHITKNPVLFRKLRHELEQEFPDPNEVQTWLRLEKLPYLQACVKEGLRLATPESMRSARITHQPIAYDTWHIPAGTSVSMSLYDVSFNEKLFPDPYVFDPERWLDEGRHLDKYQVFFGKGVRSCLGMQLAYAEVYLMLGNMFRNFEFELYETDDSDVVMAHDFFVPLPKLDSKGVRFMVKQTSLPMC